jgi:hypothetical protein
MNLNIKGIINLDFRKFKSAKELYEFTTNDDNFDTLANVTTDDEIDSVILYKSLYKKFDEIWICNNYLIAKRDRNSDEIVINPDFTRFLLENSFNYLEEYKKEKNKEQEDFIQNLDINSILDEISKVGLENISSEEKNFLDDISEKSSVTEVKLTDDFCSDKTEKRTLPERGDLNSDSINYGFINLYGISHGEKYKKLSNQRPCQDYMSQQDIESGDVTWNIAIVSDGAGSSKKSEIASKFCCEKLLKLCSDYIIAHKWILRNNLPSKEEWNISGKYLFSQTRNELLKYASENKYFLEDLKCTLAIVIRTPNGFLSCSIGDSRAGYVTDDKIQPLIVPFQTFSVGSTKFITSDDYQPYISTFVKEVNISLIQYYVLATDGCSYFWDTEGLPNHNTGVYSSIHNDAFYDKNLINLARINPIVDYFKSIASKDFMKSVEDFKFFLKTGLINEKETDFCEWLNKTMDGQDDKAIFLFIRNTPAK